MRETEMGGSDARFQPTLWSEVLKARDPSTPAAREALDRLIDLYWRPVYFFIRRKAYGVEDAKDLTQGFFTRLLESGTIGRADPARGRFRSYLLGALENFLRDELDRRHARKRERVLDFGVAETQFRPEHSFERDWALLVLERAYVKLRAEHPRDADLLGGLRGASVSYEELARRIGATEGSVKVMVHRARQRMRQLLLNELRATLEDPADGESELADLFRAFSL
jgi:RNA polymerase sigma-70 factor (ECF subfamily)